MKTIRWMIPVLAILGVAPAFGQAAHSMPPDPYDPNNNQPSSQVALPASNDYPAAEVQAVPMARAQAAAAYVHFVNSHDALTNVINELKGDFEYSADYLAAERAEKTAYEHYTAERDRVLKDLEQDAQYVALKSLSADLDNRLAGLKSHPQAEINQAEVVATAQLKLAYAMRASDMEASALKADSSFQEAKAQFIDVSQKLTDMRGRFQRTYKRDQKYVIARKDFDDAKVASAASSAMLDGAIDARNIAMYYAYWLHRYDPNTYRYYAYPTVYDGYGVYGSNYSFYPGYGRYR
jgi:hypothetical protein